MIFECEVCHEKAKSLSSRELGFVLTRIKHKYVCEDCAKEIAHNLIEEV